MEGFFSYQDDLMRDDMALLMDHGIYYEFIPMEELGKSDPVALEFREVKKAKPRALVISTNAGLWRYVVGDLVTVTSKIPLRVQVTGRITSHLNLVGEEVMEHQTDQTVAAVSTELGAHVYNYMVGPVFDAMGKPVGHHWIVEFQRQHATARDGIGEPVDKRLQGLNGDYAAKRVASLALQSPKVSVVTSGTFDTWLRSKPSWGATQGPPIDGPNRGT